MFLYFFYYIDVTDDDDDDDVTIFCELVMLIDIPTRGLNLQVGNYVSGVVDDVLRSCQTKVSNRKW